MDNLILIENAAKMIGISELILYQWYRSELIKFIVKSPRSIYMTAEDVTKIISEGKPRKCKYCNYIGPLNEFVGHRRCCKKCRNLIDKGKHPKKFKDYARKVCERNGII